MQKDSIQEKKSNLTFSISLFYPILLFILWLCPLIIFAQSTFPPPEHPIRIKALKTKEKIILDGKLDEKDWRDAPPIGNFVVVEPHQGTKPKFNTEVKILFDSAYLYIGAYCHDSLNSDKDLRVADLSRDFDFSNSDYCGIHIDAFNEKRNCSAFIVNPYGGEADFQAFNAQIYEINWNALWKVKTSWDKNGWYAEIAIPFSSLRYPKKIPGKPYLWAINFNRLKRSINESSSFPSYPRSVVFSRMTYAAELEGLEVPNPKANIQIQPYTLYEDDKVLMNDSLHHTLKPKLGVDVKWAVNTHAQLDLTINPDFAQADIDEPVINLGRSAISFPEKRQFFLDNSGLFSVGIVPTGFRSTFIQPFYSRTIGLNEAGIPVTIQGGIRYVDRTPNRTLGAMYLRQIGSDSIKATDFSIARYQKNYGEENNIGVLFTNKYEEPVHAGIQNVNNSSLSINGLNQLSPKFGISYLFSGTQEKKDKTQGYDASFSLNYHSNNIQFVTEHHLVSENYNPALGFYARQGTFYNNLWFSPSFRSAKFPKSILDLGQGLDLQIYQANPGLKLQEADLGLLPLFIDFKNGASFFSAGSFIYQNLTDTFSPLHVQIAPGIYKYWQYFLGFGSDASKHLSINFNLQFGGYFNAEAFTSNNSLRYSPNPHIVIGLNYETNYFKHLGILNSNVFTQLLVANTQIYYSPRLYFKGLLEYNSLEESFSYNTKVTWEYAPLSFIYLVLTNLKDNYLHYQESQVIGKISFVKQF